MIEFSDTVLLQLAEAARAKPNLQQCRELLLKVSAKTKAGSFLAEVTYDLAKQLVAQGKFQVARELFAECTRSHPSKVVQVLCQERSRLLNELASGKHKTSLELKALCEGANVKKVVNLQPSEFRPDISYVGCPAAYRSGYDPGRNDPLSKLLRLLKHGVEKETVHKLGEYLAAFSYYGTPILSRIDLIVPVPTNAEREFLRGYSIPRILAGEISRACAIPLHEEFVQSTGSGVELRKLPRWYRPYAAERQYTAGRKPEWLRDRIVLIIDDIITTGSTIRAVANVLRECDVREVVAVALAHTESARLKMKFG